MEAEGAGIGRSEWSERERDRVENGCESIRKLVSIFPSFMFRNGMQVFSILEIEWGQKPFLYGRRPANLEHVNPLAIDASKIRD